MFYLKSIYRQNITKPFTVLLCVCLLLLFFTPQKALAAGNGSLTVYYQGDGVRFDLYRIADKTAEGDYVLSDDFSQCSVKLPCDGDSVSTWQSSAQAMQQYVEEHEPEETASKSISGGAVRFDGLKNGLYLMLGESSVIDGISYTPIPVFVWVSAEGAVVYAKYETDEPDEPTETDEPDKPTESDEPDSSKDDVPKTGDPTRLTLWFTLLVIYAVGIVVIIFTKKKQHRE